MNTKIFVVTQKNWDNHEPDYTYPYFYLTKEDAIRNAKARAVRVNEADWAEIYGIEIFWLADEALMTTPTETQGETK